jgi:hypothetical protein
MTSTGLGQAVDGNRRVGAHHGASSAGNTGIFIYTNGVVETLPVYFRRSLENFFGAIGYAKTATFANFLIYKGESLFHNDTPRILFFDKLECLS